MINSDLKNLVDNFSHHVYLITGDQNRHYEELRLVIREKVITQDIEAADVWSRSYETVGIDDARSLKEIVLTKPSGKRRVVLLSLASIQTEAQNSLLKLFEEPSSQTVFFITAPQASIFLPTLLSRFYIVRLNEKREAHNSQISIEEFLAGNIKDRLALLEPIIKDKDKTQAENFLNALEFTLHGLQTSNPASLNTLNAEMYEDIFSARRFLRSRSSSIKMILEHLSGTVPVISTNKDIFS